MAISVSDWTKLKRNNLIWNHSSCLFCLGPLVFLPPKI